MITQIFKGFWKWFTEDFMALGPRPVSDITAAAQEMIDELDETANQLSIRAEKREIAAQKLLDGAAADRSEINKADKVSNKLEDLFEIPKRAKLPVLPSSDAAAAANS